MTNPNDFGITNDKEYYRDLVSMQDQVNSIESRMNALENSTKEIYDCMVSIIKKFLDRHNNDFPTDNFYAEMTERENKIAKELLKRRNDQ